MLIYQRGNLCWHQYNKGSLKAGLPGALFPQGMWRCHEYDNKSTWDNAASEGNNSGDTKGVVSAG